MKSLLPIDKPPGFYRLPLTRDLVERLRGIPGVLWNVDPGAGIIANWAKVPRNVLRLLDDMPEARAVLQYYDARPYWEERDSEFDGRGIKFRTTQHQAIDFIEMRRGILLGDDMRVGKTLSCVASHDPKTGPLVVLAPLSTRAVWLGWMRRVFPDTPIGVAIGQKFDIETFRKPLVFTHYEIAQHWQAMFSIGTLVLDEAHMLSNPDAKRTKACQLLAQCAKRVIAATGTPVWNRPAGVWSLLQLIMPGSWGNYYDFADRYGNPQPTGYGRVWKGISNETELNARLSDVMIRRRWIDVASDIPPISRTVAVAEVSQTDQKRLDILAGKLKTERSNTAANLAAYRRQITHLKLGVACSEAEKIISRGEPVVIWTWHRDFAEQIAERLGTPHVIHGDVGADEREWRMQAWRDSETPAPLVATMAVAQVGIDLSHACFAIFAEIDYTPAIIGQTEMRTFDPTRSMFITFIVANHVVDQRIVRALVSKLSSADPLGVAAARDSIDALREAVMGPEDHGDLDRLLEDLLASAA